MCRGVIVREKGFYGSYKYLWWSFSSQEILQISSFTRYTVRYVDLQETLYIFADLGPFISVMQFNGLKLQRTIGRIVLGETRLKSWQRVDILIDTPLRMMSVEYVVVTVQIYIAKK